VSDLANVRIVDVWERLGGAPLKHGRGRAFWRRGDNRGAVSVDPARGVWHDFVTGQGGGVLRLVEVALNVGRHGALAWLESEGLIEPRTTTPAERRVYAQRRGRAREMARLASFWHLERLADVEDAKRAALSPLDPQALQAAASEHYRLSTLDESGVLQAWLAARAAEPVATRMLERQGERWADACKDVVRLLVNKLAEGVSNVA
jgi:hypothetical protein